MIPQILYSYFPNMQHTNHMMKKTGLGLAVLLFSAAAAANTPIPDIQPASSGQHVVINIPQQRLFLFTDGKLTKVYPVAVGKALTQTNLGEHKIGPKVFNPTWHIPLSIQKERKDGLKTIPPGPKNPLGPVFVRLGDPKLSLGIHGTNAPASVPGVRSHGCVRMKSPDALEFAKAINSGSTASVVYHMAALNVDANNNLWLAAYRDPYKKNNLNTAALRKSITAWAKAHKKTVNSKRVDAVLKAKTGAANCLTCASGVKLKAPLKSVAWTSGSAALTKPKFVPKPAPVAPKDQVLPTGTEIEIDAGDTTSAASAAASASRPTAPRASSAPVKPPYAPVKSDPNDPTGVLF